MGNETVSSDKLTICRSNRRCSMCHGTERYIISRKCAECARKRNYERKVRRERNRVGLRPLKADRDRETLRQGREWDARKRERAKAAGERRYASTLPCRKGHHPVDRYTSSGGCVLCAKQSAAKRYAPFRGVPKEYRQTR